VAIERTKYNDNPTIVKPIVPIGVVSPFSSDDIIAGTELNCRQPRPTQPIISADFLFNISISLYSRKINFFLCMTVLYHSLAMRQALFDIYNPL
jgi:hypothetical protein